MVKGTGPAYFALAKPLGLAAFVNPPTHVALSRLGAFAIRWLLRECAAIWQSSPRASFIRGPAEQGRQLVGGVRDAGLDSDLQKLARWRVGRPHTKHEQRQGEEDDGCVANEQSRHGDAPATFTPALDLSDCHMSGDECRKNWNGDGQRWSVEDQ